MKPVQLIVILDKSGSMSSSTSQVIESYNTFLEQQKIERGEAILTLVVFDDTVRTIHNCINIKTAPKLTSSEYYASGMTAMYDAIGNTIGKSQWNGKGIVFIQTDGHENSSTSWNSSNVKTAIQEKMSKGWEFLFMAANINVNKAATKIGLEAHAVAFDTSAKGLETAFGTMSNRASSFRASQDKVQLTPKGY